MYFDHIQPSSLPLTTLKKSSTPLPTLSLLSVFCNNPKGLICVTHLLKCVEPSIGVWLTYQGPHL